MANFDEQKKQVRLFIGVKIELSATCIDFFSSLKSSLKTFTVNWVPYENMHLTIKFIGEKPTYYVNSLCMVLQESLKSFPSFEVTLSSIGTFGKPEPKVIWMGINSTILLEKLFNKLNSDLAQLGIENNTKQFFPHLTLGRIKQVGDTKILQENSIKYQQVEFQSVKINKVYLFESILLPKGPVYKVLAEYGLSRI